VIVTVTVKKDLYAEKITVLETHFSLEMTAVLIRDVRVETPAVLMVSVV